MSDFNLATHPPFNVTTINASSTQLTLTWQSQPSAIYVIEGTERVADPASRSPVDQNIASGGTTTTKLVPHGAVAWRFYRVRTQP